MEKNREEWNEIKQCNKALSNKEIWSFGKTKVLLLLKSYTKAIPSWLIGNTQRWRKIAINKILWDILSQVGKNHWLGTTSVMLMLVLTLLMEWQVLECVLGTVEGTSFWLKPLISSLFFMFMRGKLMVYWRLCAGWQIFSWNMVILNLIV